MIVASSLIILLMAVLTPVVPIERPLMTCSITPQLHHVAITSMDQLNSIDLSWREYVDEVYNQHNQSTTSSLNNYLRSNASPPSSSLDLSYLIKKTSINSYYKVLTFIVMMMSILNVMM